MLEDAFWVLTPDRNTSSLAPVVSECGPVPSLLSRKPHLSGGGPSSTRFLRGVQKVLLEAREEQHEQPEQQLTAAVRG